MWSSGTPNLATQSYSGIINILTKKKLIFVADFSHSADYLEFSISVAGEMRRNRRNRGVADMMLI